MGQRVCSFPKNSVTFDTVALSVARRLSDGSRDARTGGAGARGSGRGRHRCGARPEGGARPHRPRHRRPRPRHAAHAARTGRSGPHGRHLRARPAAGAHGRPRRRGNLDQFGLARVRGPRWRRRTDEPDPHGRGRARPRGADAASLGAAPRPVQSLRGRDARRGRAPARRDPAGDRTLVERQHPQAHPARPHIGGPGGRRHGAPADARFPVSRRVRGPVCPGLGWHAGGQDDAAARARGRAAAFAARHLLRGGLRTGAGELGSRGHADAPAGRGGDGGKSPCETSCASPCVCDPST